MERKYIILHEYGEPKHFLGLFYLFESNGFGYDQYEVDYIRQFRLGVKKKSLHHIYKGIKDFIFLHTIQYKKPTKIILSIAPYNKAMVPLRKKLKKHRSYFFISYTIWDQSVYVHDYNNDQRIIDEWRGFLLNDVEHIFVVSEKTKREMILNNFAKEGKISVVNHSYKTKVQPKENKRKTNSFITVAVLSEKKGISELLDIFKTKPELRLIIVGRGPLEDKVKEYANNFSNIIYKGYIDNQQDLFNLYKEASFLLLNSHKEKSWEELFGMVIIESSACGVVPIATNHSGPMEIIHDGIDGFLCEEGNIGMLVEKCEKMGDDEYDIIRKRTIINGQNFYVANISKRWQKILE